MAYYDFGLFQDRRDVELVVGQESVLFNTRDESGCTWAIEDIDGWWGLPEPSLPDDSRPYSQDGNYLTSGRYGPRIITVTGTIIPPSDAIDRVIPARTRLNRLLNLVRQTGVFTVVEPLGARQAEVQISGRPLTRINKLNGSCEFSITLRASDPRKYSTDAIIFMTGLEAPATGRGYPRQYPYFYGSAGTQGIVTLENPGSYNTNGVIRFDGPVNNPGVEHIESGRALDFNVYLSNTDSLYVDLLNRTVLLNQQESRRGTMQTGSRWFTINPGRNSLRFRDRDRLTSAAGSAEPSMNVIYRPAWIE